MTSPIQIIASRYRLVRELGRGGMGVVYIVEHTRTGDMLALKLLHGQAAEDPQSIERFKREARASARIKSEHVVKVVDADVAPELQNAPFLVMELLDGSDLEKMVQTHGRIAPDEVVRVLGQAARALDKSHAVGLVHRDLKPENLFMHRREDGTTILKILDFGISKMVGGDSAGDMASANMTSTGAVMGTPLYMAPEQARGRISEIGPATDIWAMGLIGLYLLTGGVYWRAKTIGELMAQIIAEPMYPPSEQWPWLPPGIDAWFARSCARDPKARFASIGQQIEALSSALGFRAGTFPQSSQRATPISAPAALTNPTGATPLSGARTTAAVASARGQTSERRSAAPWVVVALLVLGGGGATGWVLKTRVKDSQATPAIASVAAPTPPVASVPPVAPPATVVVDAGAPLSVVVDASGGSSESDASRPSPVQHVHAVPRPPSPAAPPAAPARPAAASTAFNPAAP